jgi:hypothetical protein
VEGNGIVTEMADSKEFMGKGSISYEEKSGIKYKISQTARGRATFFGRKIQLNRSRGSLSETRI